jgi:hypothetical protein
MVPQIANCARKSPGHLTLKTAFPAGSATTSTGTIPIRRIAAVPGQPGRERVGSAGHQIGIRAGAQKLHDCRFPGSLLQFRQPVDLRLNSSPELATSSARAPSCVIRTSKPWIGRLKQGVEIDRLSIAGFGRGNRTLPVVQGFEGPQRCRHARSRPSDQVALKPRS